MLRCALIAVACTIAPLQSAGADEDDVWIPPDSDFVAMGAPFDAVATLREQLSAGQINLCGFAADHSGRAQELASVTGNAVTIRCAGIETPVVMPFASHAMFGLGATERQERLMHCETRDASMYYGRARRDGELICMNSAGGHGRYEKAALRRFVTAWTFLSRTACMPLMDDAAIRQSLANAPPITPDIEESLRRTQIQVELAIRENRLQDAAALYRAVLIDHPNWAGGQFNHALLLTDLEFYGSAVNRLRIYLVLAPNAPDARAVQDRIYELEARLPRRPPP